MAKTDSEKYLDSEFKEARGFNFKCNIDESRGIKVYGWMYVIVSHRFYFLLLFLFTINTVSFFFFYQGCSSIIISKTIVSKSIIHFPSTALSPCLNSHSYPLTHLPHILLPFWNFCYGQMAYIFFFSFFFLFFFCLVQEKFLAPRKSKTRGSNWQAAIS